MSKLTKTSIPLRSGEPSIQLSAQDAGEIERILRMLHAARSPIGGDSANDGPARVVAPRTQRGFDVARAVMMARQARKTVFASSMFGEPAWDMLLVLYVTEQEGGRLTVSRLARSSEAPLSTAIRWLDYLDQSQLITRRPHPTDARIAYIELTETARAKLDDYFLTLLEAGHVG